MAYSLFGIFDVQLPLLYSEGKQKAFRRLREEISKASKSEQTFDEADTRCLADLRVTDPPHDKERIETTKGDLLRDSYCWVLSNTQFQRWRDEDHGAAVGRRRLQRVSRLQLRLSHECVTIDSTNRGMEIFGMPSGDMSSAWMSETASRLPSAECHLFVRGQSA